MSVVTTVMLHVDTVEDGVTLDAINRWFAEQRVGLLMDNTNADGVWGGGKAPQVRVYAGAFNYLHAEEMMAYLTALPWEIPESVQLLVNGEHDTRFAVYVLEADRGWRQLCDAGGPA